MMTFEEAKQAGLATDELQWLRNQNASLTMERDSLKLELTAAERAKDALVLERVDLYWMLQQSMRTEAIANARLAIIKDALKIKIEWVEAASGVSSDAQTDEPENQVAEPAQTHVQPTPWTDPPAAPAAKPKTYRCEKCGHEDTIEAKPPFPKVTTCGECGGDMFGA
jgi:hypothetical protein